MSTINYLTLQRAALAVGMAFGCNWVVAQTWTFDQVFQQALTTHPAVQAKKASVTAAQSDLEGANWQRYPTPSVQATTDDKGNNASLLQLQQPLWTGGRITAGIDAAQSRIEAANASVTEAQIEIGQKVIAAYVEAIRQQLRENFVRKSIKEHERLVELISHRVEREVSPSIDKELADSRMYQILNDHLLIQQSLDNALAQLTQLAGKPVKRLSESEEEGQGVPSAREAALDQAMSFSPTLLRFSSEEQAANADIASKRAVYMPQLAVRYEKNFMSLHNERAMFVLEAQPGAGLSAGAGVKAAVAKKEAIHQARDSAVRDLTERINLDWNEYLASRNRLENAKQARIMSADVFESYVRQYTTGRKSWLDVLNAIREFFQNELAVADAMAQYKASAFRLKLLTGNLRVALTN